MPLRTISLAGFDLRVVDDPGDPADAPVVILLHGFSMSADDLAPFGASMGLSAVFLFPQGPIDLAPFNLPGRAWWLIDVAARDAAIARGEDRDLSAESPAGLESARARLVELVEAVALAWPDRPLFIGGFSQGAILSLDMVVRTNRHPAGLVLLSGGRVNAATLAPLLSRAHGIPVFQSHGRQDRELSFSAALALRDDLMAAGAEIGWWPFEGGHEIPLPVLRELKKFIRRHAGSPREGNASLLAPAP